MFQVNFNYDNLQGKITNDNTADYIKKGYILKFDVFNDKTIGLPVYIELTESNLEIIKLEIDNEVFTQIKNLYQSSNLD